MNCFTSFTSEIKFFFLIKLILIISNHFKEIKKFLITSPSIHIDLLHHLSFICDFGFIVMSFAVCRHVYNHRLVNNFPQGETLAQYGLQLLSLHERLHAHGCVTTS